MCKMFPSAVAVIPSSAVASIIVVCRWSYLIITLSHFSNVNHVQ